MKNPILSALIFVVLFAYKAETQTILLLNTFANLRICNAIIKLLPQQAAKLQVATN